MFVSSLFFLVLKSAGLQTAPPFFTSRALMFPKFFRTQASYSYQNQSFPLPIHNLLFFAERNLGKNTYYIIRGKSFQSPPLNFCQKFRKSEAGRNFCLPYKCDFFTVREKYIGNFFLEVSRCCKLAESNIKDPKHSPKHFGTFWSFSYSTPFGEAIFEK